ncbi:MAG TPA: thiamine-phosphate kinase [Acidobacteriaceae bacterium]|nr:thiamine-phosphate kinase [Acidobacteriaceae bacterium]
MPRTRPVPDEGDLIHSLHQQAQWLSAKIGPASVLKLGIGDDCALLRPRPGEDIVVTTDFSLESIHFRREWHSPESAGHRCLARGLSDLAAMGAHPMAAFLSLALPAELVRTSRGSSSWRDRFLAGLLRLAEVWRVPLAGGDTAQSPVCPDMREHRFGLALADIVLVGSVPRGRALLRSGAKAGDLLYVTGYLGGAAAELHQLAHRRRSARIFMPPNPGSINPHPHLFPEPRLGVGQWLVKQRRATAAMDISDGLSTDLDRLCRASRLAAVVEASSIPIHPLATRPTTWPERALGESNGSRRDVGSSGRHKISQTGETSQESLRLALHGGDDYELLFTAPADTRLPRRIAGVPIACIGQMRAHRTGTPRMVLADTSNGKRREQPLPPQGWEHFRAPQ